MEQAVTRRGLGVDSAVLGMAVFLMVEAMFFAGLVSAVVVGRAATRGWPPAGQERVSVAVAIAATALLLASVRALSAARRAGDAVRGSLDLAAALGASFLALVGWEGYRVLGASTLPSNTYAGLLLALVGCHGVHALGGVVLLVRARRLVPAAEPASAKATRLRVCGMYWTFVVGLWPVIAAVICV